MIKRISVNRAGFIFGFSILSLFLLITWWAVFLNDSVNDHRELVYRELEAKEKLFKFHLMSLKNRPDVGVFSMDNRFEVTDQGNRKQRFIQSLSPVWDGLNLKVRNKTISSIENEFDSRKLMLLGESGVLIFIVLISIFFLYKFVRLEKRTTTEIEEFWNRVTHELKTPIMGVRSFLENLKKGYIEKKDIPIFTDMALREVFRQEHLVQNILSGQVTSNGGIILKGERIEINLFLKNYVNSHLKSCIDTVIKLENKDDPEIFVIADDHGLRIILDNLLSNAFRCAGDDLNLRVDVSKKEGMGIIGVTDNGPGFSPDSREKIFSAFKYSKGNLPGKIHGSGLGLYISRKLANEMGGDLKAISPGRGKGATFKLSLPLEKKQ